MSKPVVIDGVQVRKGLSLKAGNTTISENMLSGAAAMMGNMDRGGDVLFPGCNCFSDALPSFLKDGLVLVGHEWDELPIAMPLKAEERGRELYTEAKFHSTQDAQDARTVCVERKEAGLSIGLSIGFRLSRSGYNWFENGAELLSFAQDTLKLDMSLFDTAGIEKYTDYCRGIWKVRELYEYSIVPVPMNPEACANDAKAFGAVETERQFEEFLRASGFTKSQAVAITSGGWKALRRDADERTDASSETSGKSSSTATQIAYAQFVMAMSRLNEVL